jgi:hypothetical protein
MNEDYIYEETKFSRLYFSVDTRIGSSFVFYLTALEYRAKGWRMYGIDSIGDQLDNFRTI